jgi:RimJ/RimL family protein N-acetyltransferase
MPQPILRTNRLLLMPLADRHLHLEIELDSDQPDDPTVCDLGYRLLRRWWGNGYATEASRALLEHAFGTVGQSRVIAQTLAENAPSRAVMERLGMRYVRTYRSEGNTEVEYELSRGDWTEVSDHVSA